MNNKILFARTFKNPCPPNCANRRPACQDHCNEMIEAKQKHEEENERIRKEKYMDYIKNKTPKRDRKR